MNLILALILAQQPAPPVVTPVNLGRDMTPTTEHVKPPVVPPVVKVTIPALESQAGTETIQLFQAPMEVMEVISGGTKSLQCKHTQEDGSVSGCSLVGGATLDQAMSAILASMKITEDYRSNSLKICRDGWKAEDDIVQSYLRHVAQRFKVPNPAPKKVTIPAPKPLAAPKPVPVKLSPPPYDGRR